MSGEKEEHEGRERFLVFRGYVNFRSDCHHIHCHESYWDKMAFQIEDAYCVRGMPAIVDYHNGFVELEGDELWSDGVQYYIVATPKFIEKYRRYGFPKENGD